MPLAFDVADGSKGGILLDYQNSLSTVRGAYGQHTIQRDGMYQSAMTNTLNSRMYGTGTYGSSNKQFYAADMSTTDRWITTEHYLTEKLNYMNASGGFADDILKSYVDEGSGSTAESVGCCSILEEQNSLDFLDSLGYKFKTLADVCTTNQSKP